MEKFVILAATDFSDESLATLKKAEELAQLSGGELHIAHVVEEGFFGASKDISIIREHSFAAIKTALPSLQKERFYCKSGDVKEELSKLAKELDASILTIGGGGESSFLEELFIGSHTKEIIRSMHIPVLIVKNDRTPKYKRILVPTDFSSESRITAKKAAAMFPEAKIILFNTYAVPFENRLSIYGFSADDVADFHGKLRAEAQRVADSFFASLELPSQRGEVRVQKGSLSHKRFAETIAPMEVDLIALHTTGSFSFFAFDILESSQLDVLMYKL